ncbi:hypothetical protein ACWN8V_07855 [Vagococcus elongatus]|uniref:Peptidase M50 domain-containing protein n=1 Tax=Vagococcus elongatus TaxID=180344 RepID=A0A430ATZ9_9ENTE|nr:hypothetical protein [Vagococcus elongatus]RSU11531.1 hypothetical protein CBF29_07555 [Vagococcus elongatus]
MRKKTKTRVKQIIFILVCACFGFVLGITIGKAGVTTPKIIIYSFSVVLFYIMHIFIHEAGHGFFGSLTGHKMLSYRIFSFMWLWQEDGKIVFRRLKVPGTLGQCLMSPPKFQDENYPYRLYIMGGVLANLFSSLLIGLLFIPSSVFAVLFVLAGLFIAITNAIPMGFNDGMTYKIASSSPEQQYLLYLQMEVNSRLTKGQTYQEMPEEYLRTVPAIPERTYFNDYQIFLQIGLAFDKQDWDDFRNKLEDLWKERENLISLYQTELKKELLFALCLQDPQNPRIPDLWEDKIVKASLKQSLMGNRRIEAAYYYFIANDKQKAVSLLNKGISLKEKAPNLGDSKMELRTINYLLDIMGPDLEKDI